MVSHVKIVLSGIAIIKHRIYVAKFSTLAQHWEVLVFGLIQRVASRV